MDLLWIGAVERNGIVGRRMVLWAAFSHQSLLYFTNAAEKVDIYGLGSSIYTVMTGSYPYWQYERDDKNKRIQRGEAVPMEPYWRQKNTFDCHLSNLIWYCMEHNFA
eukprot:Nitzschia sp. Nitz4//scaffold248_size28759//1306//1626//NITZ4_008103-RA/size28759-processed-gene-0.23-mRNA-1//1//CDS//3329543974//8777//frame0